MATLGARTRSVPIRSRVVEWRLVGPVAARSSPQDRGVPFMRINDIIGFVLIPTALFLGAWVLKYAAIASSVLTATLPWICVMVGIVLLLLGATCLILQKPPAELPLTPTLMVCIVASLGLLFGLFVDVHYYYPEADKGEVLIEWLGVTLILGVLFFAPRMRSSGA